MVPHRFVGVFEGKYGDVHTLWACEETGASNGEFYYHYDFTSFFCHKCGVKLSRNIIIAKSDDDAIHYLRIFLIHVYSNSKRYMRKYDIKCNH